MIWLYRTVVVVALASIPSTAAAGQVQEIPGNWESAEMRRIPVVSAAASSALAAAGGQYAPARATDGDRHTKWVASVAPSQSDPQWIILQLAGSQAVSAVAVFGERIDNDGILDAQVQAAGPKPGEFTAVATIANAKSGSWLDPFEREMRSLWHMPCDSAAGQVGADFAAEPAGCQQVVAPTV